MPTYKIVRQYLNHYRRSRTLRRGLTLAEAQAHCRDSETSSSTAASPAARYHTANCGPWFDGYDAE